MVKLHKHITLCMTNVSVSILLQTFVYVILLWLCLIVVCYSYFVPTKIACGGMGQMVSITLFFELGHIRMDLKLDVYTHIHQVAPNNVIPIPQLDTLREMRQKIKSGYEELWQIPFVNYRLTFNRLFALVRVLIYRNQRQKGYCSSLPVSNITKLMINGPVMNIDLGLQTYNISGRFVYVNRDIKLVTSHFE